MFVHGLFICHDEAAAAYQPFVIVTQSNYAITSYSLPGAADLQSESTT